MSTNAIPRPQPDRAAAQRNREAALARLGRARGVSVLGAGALTAGIAALVSAIAPGHSLGAKRRTVVAAVKPAAPRVRTTRHAAKLPPLASPSQLGLQSPGAAPSAPTQQSVPAAPQGVPSAPQSSAPSVQSSAPSGPVVSGGS